MSEITHVEINTTPRNAANFVNSMQNSARFSKSVSGSSHREQSLQQPSSIRIEKGSIEDQQ